MEPLLPASPPAGYGRDAADFLASRGLVPRRVPLRASHYGMDPFTYYLTVILGITSALSYSTALTRGSWFHLWGEHDWDADPSSGVARLEKLLEARLTELRDICAGVGIVGDSLTRVLEREKKDWAASRAYHRATAVVEVDSSRPGSTLRSLVTAPHLECLGVEVELSYNHPTFGAMGGRCDALLLHKPRNQLWILDRKTTDYSPRLRASLCPEEMQTWHYLFMVRELLKNDDWRRQFGLTPSTSLGGMMHDITQKCPLVYAACDRHYTLDTTPLKSGPRKGQPRNEKEYYGEPVFENYLERVISWYTATGDYEHLGPERTAENGPGQPCDLSFTPSSILDDHTLARYNVRLTAMHELASRDPVPLNFPSNPRDAVPYGKATALTPFYLFPPSQWPEIIARNRLIVPSPTERTLTDVTDLTQPDAA